MLERNVDKINVASARLGGVGGVGPGPDGGGGVGAGAGAVGGGPGLDRVVAGILEVIVPSRLISGFVVGRLVRKVGSELLL